MEMYVKLYNEDKWLMESELIGKLDYKVESYEVIDDQTNPDKVYEIEKRGWIDTCHEYLVLKLENGDEAFFRNSRVDLFKVA